MLFHNRRDAGKQLAIKLSHYYDFANVVVLALPRGGVPVAYEVAQALKAPLDLFLVRKLGTPGQEELAMGAIASGGIRVLNDEVIESLGISEEVIAEVAAREEQELERRRQMYGAGNVEVGGKIVFLVDDGLATGSTMRAAISALKVQGPERVVVAVPVAAEATCEELRLEVDEVVCLATPNPFYAVGYWYQDFAATTDEEIIDLLSQQRSGTSE